MAFPKDEIASHHDFARGRNDRSDGPTRNDGLSGFSDETLMPTIVETKENENPLLTSVLSCL